MPVVCMIDDPRERVEQWRPGLAQAGYDVEAVSDSGEVRLPARRPDAIVLGAPSGTCRAWDVLAMLRGAERDVATVPVVLIVEAGALEDGLRGAIEGAVRCIAEPVEVDTLVAVLDAVLARDALPQREQQRRARQRALEVLARIEARGAAADDDDVHPRLVHLTRLEHGPIRSTDPDPVADARRRLGVLTPKQRALLALVEAEGGVTAAAARLDTSRGNVYAGLRRIVHRLGMRDTRELLRLLDNGELLRSARV